MEGHRNYYRSIYYLILLKNEFYRIEKNKYKALIAELSKYTVLEDSDNDHLPSHKDLSKVLKYTQARTNKLLKDLHWALISDFTHKLLKIKECVHQIHIQFSYEEQNGKDKKRREWADERSTWLEVELPRTPTIGEEIDLSFMNGLDKFERGCVHSVRHKITGNRQEIYIEVHPIYDYYYKWQRMKNKYEADER